MLAITGTPGTGKHTIGQQIAQEMKLDIIDISEIAISNGLAKRGRVNDINTDELVAILKPYLTSRSLVIGHLVQYVLDAAAVTRIIILRRNPYELERVYQRRRYSKSKTHWNMGSEILDIIAADTLVKFRNKAVEIDVSGKTIDESVRSVSTAITSNTKNNYANIDWLSLVEDKGDLHRIFDD